MAADDPKAAARDAWQQLAAMARVCARLPCISPQEGAVLCSCREELLLSTEQAACCRMLRKAGESLTFCWHI